MMEFGLWSDKTNFTSSSWIINNMKALRSFSFRRYFSLIILMFLVLFLNFSCQNSNTSAENKEVKGIKDSLVLAARHFYLDSVSINNFFLNNPVEPTFEDDVNAYYKKQNFRYTWINKEGINEQAINFINVLNLEKKESLHSSLINKKLDQLFSKFIPSDSISNYPDSLLTEFELLLTVNFFNYAYTNWGGIHPEQSKQVDWFINYNSRDYGSILDSILIGKRKFEDEPVYRQYALLKTYVQYYDSIQNIHGWPNLNEDVSILKKGDTSVSILNLKELLFLLKDLSVNDKTNVFNDSLELAIKHFQKRNGFQEDGIASGKTLSALEVPIDKYIQKLLINMERCKWVPVEIKGDYLAVNIPAFELYVYNDDSLAWKCKVVVGKESTSTAIFNDEIESIVFNPYWSIPKSILRKETLPAIKANSKYLANHNMEVVGSNGKIIKSSAINWKKYNDNNFPYKIRQRPGPFNSLGKIKFLFPNPFDIYLHDTPAKSLFGENERGFSHGCIRVEEPLRLAEYLLRNDSNYSKESIKKIIDSGKQKYVSLKTPIPIFIAYFTAWVDRDGHLNFRDDIYHHDEKMTKFLFN